VWSRAKSTLPTGPVAQSRRNRKRPPHARAAAGGEALGGPRSSTWRWDGTTAEPSRSSVLVVWRALPVVPPGLCDTVTARRVRVSADRGVRGAVKIR
jgi:hypothetical protein